MNVIQWYIGLCQGLNETNRDLDYLFTIEELEATWLLNYYRRIRSYFYKHEGGHFSRYRWYINWFAKMLKRTNYYIGL